MKVARTVRREEVGKVPATATRRPPTQLLPEVLEEPRLPLFLDSLAWVDFCRQEPDPFEQLLWGVTGEKPN
jgi:hypothetical protein